MTSVATPLSTTTYQRLLGRDSLLRRIDWVLIAASTALIVIGCLLVWSATKTKMLNAGLDPQYFLTRQMINATFGLVMAFGVAMVDYRTLRAYTPFVYAAGLLGLVAVLLVGQTINGARAWIALPGGFSLQPAEIAKVAIIIGVAMLLSERRDAEDTPRHSDVIGSLVIVVIPLGLIMLQPDLGTALVFGAITAGVIAVSGAPGRWVAGLTATAIVGGFLVIKLSLLSQYQINRLTAFANPDLDPQGIGYQVRQSRITIGSGGLLGTGLFKGPQTNGGFVPEQQTDFVFTVAGEELGFVGSASVILLLGVVLWRALRIAARTDDMFGRLVAVGVVCWFTFQGFENVGMTLGIMPMTGIPLPFVSYGGSSMFASCIAVALLINVHLRRSART